MDPNQLCLIKCHENGFVSAALCLAGRYERI